MLPLNPRNVREITTQADLTQIRNAVGAVLTSPNLPSSVMMNSDKVLTEANDKDLGDIVADGLEALIPFFSNAKIKIVLSLTAKVIRAVL